jgi:hypothetical protein
MIPWNRVLFEKLIVTQLATTFLAFNGPWNLIPYLQEPVTGPYPESDESSPYPHILSL